MDNTKQYQDQQEAKQLQNRISSFIKDFKVGTLLHGNGNSGDTLLISEIAITN
jgi:hypothetical protein